MGSFGGYLLPTKGFHVVGIFPCLVGTTHLLVGTLTPLPEHNNNGWAGPAPEDQLLRSQHDQNKEKGKTPLFFEKKKTFDFCLTLDSCNFLSFWS